MSRLAHVALALAAVAAVVAVRRGRCSVCNGWLCPIAVAGLERSDWPDS